MIKILGYTITKQAILVAGATALTHAVAAVAQKGNPIGRIAIAAALESTALTGAEKKDKAIAAVKPAAASIVASWTSVMSVIRTGYRQAIAGLGSGPIDVSVAI